MPRFRSGRWRTDVYVIALSTCAPRERILHWCSSCENCTSKHLETYRTDIRNWRHSLSELRNWTGNSTTTSS